MADPESGPESGREPSRCGLFGELYRHQDDAVAPDGIEFIAFTIGKCGSGEFQTGINVKNRIGKTSLHRYDFLLFPVAKNIRYGILFFVLFLFTMM